MINSKKELKAEELENVNGGGCGAIDKYLPSNHGPHIGQYEAEKYIGQKVYAVTDQDHRTYFWGTLKKSWEKKHTTNTTKRTHLIFIEGQCAGTKNYVGTEREFDGSTYTLFLYN